MRYGMLVAGMPPVSVRQIVLPATTGGLVEVKAMESLKSQDERRVVIPLPEAFPFDLYDTFPGTDPFPTLHAHDCLEINWIKTGTGVNRIGGTDYPLCAGDVHVVNSLEHHMGISHGALCMQVLVFDPSFVLRGHPEDMKYLAPFFERRQGFSHRIPSGAAEASALRSLLTEIQTEWEQRGEGWRLAVRALLLRLLALLYRYFRHQESIGEEVVAHRRSYERIRAAVEHLKTHYREPVDLDVLAGCVHMSRTWFSTCFHNVMGIRIPAYVAMLRMEAACRLLKEDTAPVTEIALSCGYSQVSHFNRAFRRHFGMSPTQWRSGKDKNPGQVEPNGGKAISGKHPV